MRLAVLDIGSNSAHLRVVDAWPGSPPLPVFRSKAPTHLAQCVDDHEALTPDGIERVVEAVGAAMESARTQLVNELIPFATAAIRDASNRDEILEAIDRETGVRVGYLTGTDEARLTWFAAHRWYGWSTGPLLLLDIGGGSMEIANGRDEDPSFVVSLPLGAGRLTRSHLAHQPAGRAHVKALRSHVRDLLAAPVQRLSQDQPACHAVATSKTFKQLARLAGHTVGKPPRQRQVLYRDELKRWIPRLAAMTPQQRAQLSGVAPARARQILAGAITADVAMAALNLSRVEICPWALREGILLRRLSPLMTPDSLRQVSLIQAAADPDVVILDDRRAAIAPR